MLGDFFYAQMALQLELNLIRVLQDQQEAKAKTEESRRMIDENEKDMARLRNEYDIKRGKLIDLPPEAVRVVPETKFIA